MYINRTLSSKRTQSQLSLLQRVALKGTRSNFTVKTVSLVKTLDAKPIDVVDGTSGYFSNVPNQYSTRRCPLYPLPPLDISVWMYVCGRDLLSTQATQLARVHAQEDQTKVEAFMNRVLEGQEEIDPLLFGETHEISPSDVRHILSEWAEETGVTTAEEFQR